MFLRAGERSEYGSIWHCRARPVNRALGAPVHDRLGKHRFIPARALRAAPPC
ncbi:hypothetical protein L493_1015 [Bordetella bronchiseptica 99-R-0433]|nr:hypothetical protein L493_1015 [Bordetella bronchiseptica 99-R-0433]